MRIELALPVTSEQVKYFLAQDIFTHLDEMRVLPDGAVFSVHGPNRDWGWHYDMAYTIWGLNRLGVGARYDPTDVEPLWEQCPYTLHISQVEQYGAVLDYEPEGLYVAQLADELVPLSNAEPYMDLYECYQAHRYVASIELFAALFQLARRGGIEAVSRFFDDGRFGVVTSLHVDSCEREHPLCVSWDGDKRELVFATKQLPLSGLWYAMEVVGRMRIGHRRAEARGDKA